MGLIIEQRASDEQDSRRRTISFSSEEPYRRWFGLEILDHADNAVDLSRLNDVGVLLFNHKTDIVVGKVLRAWVENHRGMVEVEFDTDEEAEKIFGKVKSGTLKTTSVRYAVDAWEEVVAGKTCADGRYTGKSEVKKKKVPGSRRFPVEGNGNPLQYSCLGNPMDRGAQQAAVHGVAKSRTRLSN